MINTYTQKNKQMRRCSVSSGIRKMQIKNTTGYYYVPTRKAEMKRLVRTGAKRTLSVVGGSGKWFGSLIKLNA